MTETTEPKAAATQGVSDSTQLLELPQIEFIKSAPDRFGNYELRGVLTISVHLGVAGDGYFYGDAVEEIRHRVMTLLYGKVWEDAAVARDAVRPHCIGGFDEINKAFAPLLSAGKKF